MIISTIEIRSHLLEQPWCNNHRGLWRLPCAGKRGQTGTWRFICNRWFHILRFKSSIHDFIPHILIFPKASKTSRCFWWRIFLIVIIIVSSSFNTMVSHLDFWWWILKIGQSASTFLLPSCSSVSASLNNCESKNVIREPMSWDLPHLVLLVTHDDQCWSHLW